MFEKGESLQGMEKVVRSRAMEQPSGSVFNKADLIRQHIDSLMSDAKLRGEAYIEQVSGDLHKHLGLKN